MKTHASKLPNIVTMLVLGAAVCACGAALVYGTRTVYATPERESAFLKNYTLDPVLKPYVSPRWILLMNKSDSGGAGYGAAHFYKTFEVRFAMFSVDRQTFMLTLTQNIAMSLEDSGMRILENTGNDAEGFHFKYGDGKSVGTVTVTPVRQLDENHLGGAHGSGPRKESLRFLQPGEIPVEFTISANETWTK